MKDYFADNDSSFQGNESHISDYFLVLLKHKSLIVLVLLLTISVTLFFAFSSVPVYESSAGLMIDQKSSVSPITGQRSAFDSFYSHNMSINTTIKMITSTQLITEVISDLGMDKGGSAKDQKLNDLEVSFFRQMVRQLKANIKRLLHWDSGAVDLSSEERDNQRMQTLVRAIQSKISISQIKDTLLLNISVRDKDPRFAAKLANTLAQKYIEFDLANKMEASKNTMEWLNKKLFELKEKLEEDERKFFEYKQQHKVFSMSGKQKLAEQKIQEFNSTYLETRTQRLELDAKINELKININGIKGVASVRSIINNPMIESIYSKIVSLEIEMTRLSKIYKSKHPKIVQTQSEIEKSRKGLEEEITKERENLVSQRTVLYAREKALEKTISEFEADALDTSSSELKYTMLERNVTTSQNLYNLMVSKLKESDILESSYSSSNIRLVENASVPTDPVAPNKKKMAFFGVVLGITLGCGLAFFFEYLDQTVRTEEDIHKYLNRPVLAVVPKADKNISYGADY